MMCKKFRMLMLLALVWSGWVNAQPETTVYGNILEANKLFDKGMYQKALENYKLIIEQQPSNGFVLERISRANEEILYAKILEGEEVEANALEYLNLYDSGKYVVSVQNELSRKWLSQAYQYYHSREIDELERLYIRYLKVLGVVKSGEMKSWLYSLCYDEGVKKLKKKQWKDAKFFFQRSLKYTNSNSGDEFKNAQKGIAKASKKIR